MKITKQEAQAIARGREHVAAVQRLTKVLEDSSITRRSLCSILGSELLIAAGFDEHAAREQAYRLLALYDAALQGEAFTVEQDPEPEHEPPPERPPSAPRKGTN